MIGFLFFVLTVLVVGMGIVGVAAGLRRLNAPERERISSAQLERLESALSAVEARIDDLQDQQRFLERLLEARPDVEALGPGEAREPEAAEPDAGGSILFETEPEEER